MASLLSAPALKKTKLLFAITSPDLCNAPIDDIQRSLNDQAAAIMAKNKIPTVDLCKMVVLSRFVALSVSLIQKVSLFQTR